MSALVRGTASALVRIVLNQYSIQLSIARSPPIIEFLPASRHRGCGVGVPRPEVIPRCQQKPAPSRNQVQVELSRVNSTYSKRRSRNSTAGPPVLASIWRSRATACSTQSRRRRITVSAKFCSRPPRVRLLRVGLRDIGLSYPVCPHYGSL